MVNFDTRKTLFVLIAMCFSSLLFAQKQTPLDIALRYVEQQRAQWQLDKTDVGNMLVNSQYETRHNGVTHIYFLQRYRDVPIYNAIMGVHITSDGRVAFANSRFHAGLSEKVNATEPLVSPKEAVVKAAGQLQLTGTSLPIFKHQKDNGAWVFEDKGISQMPIEVRPMYQPMPDGSLRLAWDLTIQPLDSEDYWNVRIDALNGTLLDRFNWTLYCTFDADGSHAPHRHTDACTPNHAFRPVPQALLQQNMMPVDGAQYRVFGAPVESPVHGPQTLVVNPADPLASPFGWHDTNGQPGPEFTITQGNNAHAFVPGPGTQGASNGQEPDGGELLIFDFVFNPILEPTQTNNQQFAVVQLFYMTNFMHDFAYLFGFDEAAGNFQQNNYARGGNAGDYVIARAQDDSRRNNASFSTPSDGGNGVMRMHLWDVNTATPLVIQSPAGIAGTYSTGTAQFGLRQAPNPISGQVVAVRSNDANPNIGCGTITNAGALVGKIALIERGVCTFKEKVLNAQRAGAIGVIICNTEDALLSMADPGNLTDPTIPAVLIRSSHCKLIRDNLNQGVEVTLQLPKPIAVSALDATIDNGIVAHEYGHGISIRLTGGPEVNSCLVNEEQMGEGWSDFFTLVTTVQAPAAEERTKGIGTYVFNLDPSARGIRRLPYSADMNQNGQTYNDIIGAAIPHGVGEVWAGVLWDMYWTFSDLYGWDADPTNRTAGNNIAIQLAMDGMKLQTCNPGYLDGRDAIIAADLIDNGGANECLLWEIFARRGLGFDADQGTAFNAYDGRAGFATLPECVRELKIAKEATPTIEAGDEITYKITVTNHKEQAVSGVVVRDELPVGLSFIGGSATGGITPTVEGNTVRFDVGNLAAGEVRTLSYKASTPADNFSVQLFLDDVENGIDNWLDDVIIGTDLWDITNQRANSGTFSLFIPNTARANDHGIQLAEPLLVTGEQPVLRFFHFYDTDPGRDGGIVEISNDNGQTWTTADQRFFRNGYYGRISPATFRASGLRAYTGRSRRFLDSYVDLSDYVGQEIRLRFRFASLEEQNERANQGIGWFVDDVELMDMRNYQSAACVTSGQGDQACAEVPEGGTIVESGVLTSTEDLALRQASLQVYPNPASEVTNLSVSVKQPGPATISIFGADGRLLQRQQVSLFGESQLIPIDLSRLAKGFYLIELKTEQAVVTEKIIVR